MCVSMLDSHRACISYCVNAGLPQSLDILLCECVFPCWTPTELVYPRVNVCFHAGLPQSLSVIRLYEKEGFELVALFKCLPSHGQEGCSIQYSCMRYRRNSSRQTSQKTVGRIEDFSTRIVAFCLLQKLEMWSDIRRSFSALYVFKHSL